LNQESFLISQQKRSGKQAAKRLKGKDLSPDVIESRPKTMPVTSLNSCQDQVKTKTKEMTDMMLSVQKIYSTLEDTIIYKILDECKYNFIDACDRCGDMLKDKDLIKDETLLSISKQTDLVDSKNPTDVSNQSPKEKTCHLCRHVLHQYNFIPSAWVSKTDLVCSKCIRSQHSGKSLLHFDNISVISSNIQTDKETSVSAVADTSQTIGTTCNVAESFKSKQIDATAKSSHKPTDVN